MLILETPVFTRQIQALLSDEEYRLLQLHLSRRPKAGAVIRRSGGLRKLRWSGRGRGKRGGVRVIYYWLKSQRRLLMLLAYSKTEQDDLAPGQLRVLRKLIKKEEYP